MLGIGAPGPWELLIVLAIVLVIFGPTKLKGLGKGLGASVREFRDGISGKDGDEKASPPAESTSQSAESTPPADD